MGYNKYRTGTFSGTIESPNQPKREGKNRHAQTIITCAALVDF